jgi:hypothetical protein
MKLARRCAKTGKLIPCSWDQENLTSTAVATVALFEGREYIRARNVRNVRNVHGSLSLAILFSVHHKDRNRVNYVSSFFVRVQITIRKAKSGPEPEFFAKNTPGTAIVDFERHNCGQVPSVNSQLRGNLVDFPLQTGCEDKTASRTAQPRSGQPQTPQYHTNFFRAQMMLLMTIPALFIYLFGYVTNKHT